MATSRVCFAAKLELFNACTELIDYICKYNGLHINMNALHAIVLSVQSISISSHFSSPEPKAHR